MLELQETNRAGDMISLRWLIKVNPVDTRCMENFVTKLDISSWETQFHIQRYQVPFDHPTPRTICRLAAVKPAALLPFFCLTRV